METFNLKVTLMQAFASINSPETGETLDKGIALRFPGPASFTGQPYTCCLKPFPVTCLLTLSRMTCGQCNFCSALEMKIYVQSQILDMQPPQKTVV